MEHRLRCDTKISNYQFGYTRKVNHGGSFSLSKIKEEMRRKEYMVFIDLEKTYDEVLREVLWQMLEKRKFL